jgi:hypothetical protein
MITGWIFKSAKMCPDIFRTLSRFQTFSLVSVQCLFRLLYVVSFQSSSNAHYYLLGKVFFQHLDPFFFQDSIDDIRVYEVYPKSK